MPAIPPTEDTARDVKQTLRDAVDIKPTGYCNRGCFKM
jgi:hypothetical protein